MRALADGVVLVSLDSELLCLRITLVLRHIRVKSDLSERV